MLSLNFILKIVLAIKSALMTSSIRNCDTRNSYSPLLKDFWSFCNIFEAFCYFCDEDKGFDENIDLESVTKRHEQRCVNSKCNINFIFGPFLITTEIFGGGLVCRKK